MLMVFIRCPHPSPFLMGWGIQESIELKCSQTSHLNTSSFDTKATGNKVSKFFARLLEDAFYVHLNLIVRAA